MASVQILWTIIIGFPGIGIVHQTGVLQKRLQGTVARVKLAVRPYNWQAFLARYTQATADR
jgi:hypothetical protein